MLRKVIIRDLIGALLLLIGCLILGLVVNEMRPSPLPLVYSSPQSRLNQPPENSNQSVPIPSAPDPDVNSDEMQTISSTHEALIVDARSETLYRAGHIPSAISLPRDNFDQRYQALRSTLESHRDQPIIVYCSGLRCPDSQVVAAALKNLGYPHVRLFPGGWNDWQTAHLPEEK